MTELTGKTRSGKRRCVEWARRKHVAAGFMLAADSYSGRLCKLLLFGLGLCLPLGAIIWLLLIWHGSKNRREGLDGKPALAAY